MVLCGVLGVKTKTFAPKLGWPDGAAGTVIDVPMVAVVEIGSAKDAARRIADKARQRTTKKDGSVACCIIVLI
jgi:hypothetical protein